MKILLNAEEVAETIGLSRSKVFEMKSAGQLPTSIKLGRSRKWRRVDIERWCELGCPSLREYQQRCEGVER